MVEAPQVEYKIRGWQRKAMLNGIAPQQVVGNLTYLLREMPVSNLYDERSNNPVGIIFIRRQRQNFDSRYSKFENQREVEEMLFQWAI